MKVLRRIAYFSHSIDIGGAEVSLFHLIKGLDREKFIIYLICPENSKMIDFFSKLEVNIVKYKIDDTLLNIRTKDIKLAHIPFIVIKNTRNILETIYFIRKKIKKYKIDVIHSNSMKAHFLSPFIKLKNTVLIWHIRDLISSNIVRSILKLLSNRVDSIIAISGFVAENLEINNKTKIIYNCVDFSNYSGKYYDIKKELGLSKSDKLLLSIGQLTERKGFHFLLPAFQKVHNKNKDIKLCIVGTNLFHGPEYFEQLKMYIKKNNLEQSVYFLGFRKDVPDILRSSDLFVFPSINEPFGRVVIEAMAANIPIIASNSGGIPEIIQNEISGLLVENGDVAAIESAMESILGNENLSKHLVNNAQREKDKYLPQKHVKEIVKIYNTLLGEEKCL